MAFYSQSKANLNSVPGKIFALSWGLDNHRKNMIKQAKSKTQHINAKKLEKLLNDLGEVEEQEKYLSKEIFSKIDESYFAFLEDLITHTEVNEETGKIVMRGIDKDTNSIRININTIYDRLGKIKNIINNINPKTMEQIAKDEKLSKYITFTVDEVAERFKKIFGKNETWFSSITPAGFLRNNTKEIGLAISQLNALYAAVLYINEGDNAPQIYGAAFERKLDLFSQLLQKKANVEVNNLIDDIFAVEETGQFGKKRAKYVTAGGGSVDRGAFESDIFKTEGKQKLLRDSSEDDKICKINAFDEKQGKMDIRFILPNNYKVGTQFRISAKSWNGLSGKDFGSTSLFNALARSGGLDNALAYGLTVGYYNPVGKLWDKVYAHEFAKTCIFLDIVMGYSQKTGYADTIVIEDRSVKKIKVFSIYDLLTLVEKSVNKIESIQYSYNFNIREYLKLNKNSNTKSWWIHQLQTKMHQIKVSVSSGILNEN